MSSNLGMGNKIDPSHLISQSEAADLRGVSRQAIHELVQKGRFETVEIGGTAYLIREEVAKYTPKKAGRPPSSGKKEKD